MCCIACITCITCILLAYYLHNLHNLHNLFQQGVGVSYLETLGPIDRTPGIPGSDKKVKLICFFIVKKNANFTYLVARHCSHASIRFGQMLIEYTWIEYLTSPMKKVLVRIDHQPAEDWKLVCQCGPRSKAVKRRRSRMVRRQERVAIRLTRIIGKK